MLKRKIKRTVKCPSCETHLDELGEVRYDQSFHCTNCRVEIQVPKYYKLLIFWLGIAIDFSLCLAMRMRDGALALGLLVFLLPSLFSVGILFRRIMPPKLVIYRDPNSILN